ncbi:hypothetical protein FRC10_002936 [Ceratobasidium sp. 414]|nr:hypothetical protein FRC10_002936 [Ceratobasidium sp. 414]
MSLVLHPSERIHPPPLSNPHPSLGHVLDHDDDDEYDDDEPLSAVGHASSREARTVRKRSSKACDNCRKAKCKCEKSPDSTACRNCALLGQECTFLGPSRKRGPPKGYIDAIEARLHQLEALLGTVIASPDPRAQSLIADLISDPLARHIIARVDESPFGSRGRDQDGARDPKARTHINSARTAILNGGVGFDVPPRDWQDELGARILSSQHKTTGSHRHHSRTPSSAARSPPHDSQRRRLSSSGSASPNQPLHPQPFPPSESDTEPDTITDALGQLSLNEHQQLRYHGKASGLHLLAQAPAYRTDRARMDEAGIWRFPSSRVWPPVAEEHDTDEVREEGDYTSPRLVEILKGEDIEHQVLGIMPSRAQQERLLKLYFAYVHPILPVIHKEVFWHDWEASARPDAPASSRIPTLLLLAIYSVAARYDARPARRSRAGTMWAAGDRYLEAAKVLLNRSYASSKASTCQALLLLSYREIGIGAMAQAWLYVGMSVRMAQDLGLHRSIDKWQAAGANSFSAAEKQTRRCIWFGCVVMDKYVSTYIGRPLAVFERDYDTRWPDSAESESQGEEKGDDVWVDIVKEERGEAKGGYEPAPGKVLECFSAASKLSAILSHIVEGLYSIRPSNTGSRSAERIELEEQLEKWMLALPPYLRYDISRGVVEESGKRFAPASAIHPIQQTASPNIPRRLDDIGQLGQHVIRTRDNVMPFSRESHHEDRPAFLSYYVFSASIMHVTLLMMNPEDVHAQLGLQQCMSALETMDVTWPSAGRAYELLTESKMNIQAHYLEMLRCSPSRVKRKTTEEADEVDEMGVAQGGTVRESDPLNVTMDNTMMRDGGMRLAPLRERDGRPIVGLRSESVQFTRMRDGMSPMVHTPSPAPIDTQLKQLPHATRSIHSPAPPLLHNPRSIRHAQPPPNPGYANLPPNTYQPPVEPIFQDPGYARWGSEVPYAQPDGSQAYFANSGNWDGHVPQQPQQQHGQGWSTSAARFSVDGGRGPHSAGPGAGNGGGYWQDYQPQAFGNDMAQSLYGIMPPVGHVPNGVGLQTMFQVQDGSAGVYDSPDGTSGISPSYPVYSRLN